MRLAAEIATYKRENGLPVGDPAREREILERAAAQAGPELARYIEAALLAKISKIKVVLSITETGRARSS